MGEGGGGEGEGVEDLVTLTCSVVAHSHIKGWCPEGLGRTVVCCSSDLLPVNQWRPCRPQLIRDESQVGFWGRGGALRGSCTGEAMGAVAMATGNRPYSLPSRAPLPLIGPPVGPVTPVSPVTRLTLVPAIPLVASVASVAPVPPVPPSAPSLPLVTPCNRPFGIGHTPYGIYGTQQPLLYGQHHCK